jgi:hypothetical protein
MSNEFGVNLVIIDKNDLISGGMMNWKPSNKWKKLDVGESAYSVFTLK